MGEVKVKLSPWTDRVPTDGFACCGRFFQTKELALQHSLEVKEAEARLKDYADAAADEQKRIRQIQDNHVASVKEQFLHEYELLCIKHSVEFYIAGDTSYESPWLDVGYKE